jgi:hypothetical protein
MAKKPAAKKPAAPKAVPAQSAAAKQPLKKSFPQPQGEWKGNHCAVHHAGHYVAKTQAEWENLWDTTFADQHPAPAAPKLPRGKMAVAIFTGQASSPADINITRIEHTDGVTNIVYTAEHKSSMLCVMNDPYLIKWMDKTDDAISFTKESPRPAAPAIDIKTLRKKM